MYIKMLNIIAKIIKLLKIDVGGSAANTLPQSAVECQLASPCLTVQLSVRRSHPASLCS